MKSNTDLRFVKTEKNIKKVFLELMEEMGFSKLNVKNLVERAEINRSTFYLHYVDKFDLLNRIEDELLAGMKNIAVTMPLDLVFSSGFADERVLSIMLRMARYIYENGRVFTVLMSKNGDPAFIVKFGEIIRSVWQEKNILDNLTIPQQYALAAFIGLTSSLIGEWLRSELRETPEEYVRMVANIIRDVLKSMLFQHADLPEYGHAAITS